MIEQRSGYLVFEVIGKGAHEAFRREAGGHRYQRIPPTEKRGRVQTSTITVAVLEAVDASALEIPEADLVWKCCRGSGSGGQHRNVTDSAVQLTHVPSGVQVRCESERSQLMNRMTALSLLRARLGQERDRGRMRARNDARRTQVGSGMRGDKVRTVAIQRDDVVDHLTGKRMSAKAYMRGSIDNLW